MYLYPFQESKDEVLMNSKNIKVHPRMKPLYDYLIQNNRMVDLDEYNPEYLSIFSKEVLKMIKKGDSGWEKLVPEIAHHIIKEKMLFGYDEPVTIKEKA